MELLLVEDEQLLGKSIRQGLEEAGHACAWEKTFDAGLAAARTRRFDAIVLDLTLPDGSGLDLLATLRDEGIGTPTLILTALGSVEDRVRGLESGGDDYLVKPFAFAELLARLQALCRRAGERPAMQRAFGSLNLDLASRRVTRDGKEIDLSPTEFTILEFLMRHRGGVVTRKMLSEQVWGEDWEGMSNLIEVHINHLRRKLDRGFSESLIVTVRGRGYALKIDA